MFLLTPISNCGQSSAQPRSPADGEHMGERVLGPCVQAVSATARCADLSLYAGIKRHKSVRACDLRAHLNSVKGGVLYRLEGRSRRQNLESGRERPPRNRLFATRLASRRGRSRPDLALNVPQDVGQLRPRVVPQSPAPLTDTVARLARRLAGSFAA